MAPFLSVRGEVDPAGHLIPVGDFLFEASSSRGGEGVELRPPVALGDAPLGVDEAFGLEAGEGGVERALFDEEISAGGLLDAQENAIAV